MINIAAGAYASDELKVPARLLVFAAGMIFASYRSHAPDGMAQPLLPPQVSPLDLRLHIR